MENQLGCSGVVKFQGGVKARFNDVYCFSATIDDYYNHLKFIPFSCDIDKYTIDRNCDASIIATDGEVCFHIEETVSYNPESNVVEYLVSNVRAERKG